MAAILCESISKVLKAGCEACGTVISLPCKIVGSTISTLCRSPFCPYLTVAVGFNIPPIVFAIKAWSANGGCDVASSWLNLNAWLCIINIFVALYISAKISIEAVEDENVNDAPYVEATVTSKSVSPTSIQSQQKRNPVQTFVDNTLVNDAVTDTRAGSVGRIKAILCYDPIVAFYIIIAIFYMVWQTLGISRSYAANDCNGDWDEYIFNSLMCGFMFISLGAMTFAISLCCLGGKWTWI